MAIGSAKIRVIMGEAFDHASPVQVHSPTLYLEARLERGASLELAADYEERGIYVVSGELRLAGGGVSAGRMLVTVPGRTVELVASAPTRLMVVGGAPVGERHIWWNFVSSRLERIEQAKQDWRHERFGRIEGDNERIPLPDDG